MSRLEEYRRRRRFEHTPEPGPQARESLGPKLSFVVQKHSASHLHYDLRLELGGVLKSWAVPKGPSLDPTEKRLAVLVEDHPLDYATFEGVIPKGEYGAGEVIVWDRGVYGPEEDGRLIEDRARAEEAVTRGLSQGKLSLHLFGSKLNGSWALVRLRSGEQKDWLLIKHQDEFVDTQRNVLTDDRSVLSGRTIKDLQTTARPSAAQQTDLAVEVEAVPGALKAPFPDRVAPMLATLTEGPFSHQDWFFEPKLDGVRVIALIRSGEVKLLSRRGLESSAQYPSLRDRLKTLSGEIVLDGEVVALDTQGRPSFQRLQQRMNLADEKEIRRAEAEVPVVYFVFDLLYLDGYDLRGSPLEERKRLLKSVLRTSGTVQLLDHFERDGELAYQAAVEHGFEGLVAKRRGSRYESGKRSRGWLKVKATRSDDFVIGGYTGGLGKRGETLGALLVGTREKGKLVYVAHVGTGFDEPTLARLRKRLESLRTGACPFEKNPPLKGPTTWVHPELVAEVKFAEWTRDGHLRAPVFLGLREDKTPAEAKPAEIAPRPANEGKMKSGTGISTELQDVLEQLKKPHDKLVLRVEGHKLPLSNLNKPFWPADLHHPVLTKRDLIAYLATVSPFLLPHMRDRPLTLRRYPDGIFGLHFFQKHWADPLPEFVATVRLYSEQNEADQDYLMCNNLATLLWLGQIADIELHTWYSRVNPEPDARDLPRRYTGSVENIQRSLLNYPDFMVFDLDPYIYSGKEARGEEPELNERGFAMTCQAAHWLKEVLDSLSLSAFVKTSGRTGLHVFVPVFRRYDYDAIRAQCRTIAEYLVQLHPRELTTEWTVSRRRGKVFVDYNQNARSKTLASVYSPRAAPAAPVSTPLGWEELREVFPTDFTMTSLPQRLEAVGDLWAGILQEKNSLDRILHPAA